MPLETFNINRRTVLKTAGAAAAISIAQPFILHDAGAQTAVPIKLTTGLKLANYGPIYVAQRAGLFEQQGLGLTGRRGRQCQRARCDHAGGAWPVCRDRHWHGHERDG